MIGTIAGLQLMLVLYYDQSPERAAFIARETETVGYCPFIWEGRQYVTTAYKGRPGYEVHRYEVEPDDDGDSMTRDAIRVTRQGATAGCPQTDQEGSDDGR